MNSIEVRNIAALLDAIRSVFDQPRTRRNWFRGHSDASWQLVPSVHRRFTAEDEVELTARFRFGAPTRYANCPASGDFARWLCLMQHFSLPTRLLDWTESPLIAAFFAIAHEPRSGPAAIWCLSPGDLNQVTTGRFRLKLLPTEGVSHLLRPAFVGGDSPDEVLAVVGQEVDLRMSVQQGGFTIHGKPSPLEAHPQATQFLRKFVIPEDCREAFREELWLLGVRRSMLFPDIENLARELSDEWQHQRKKDIP
jgi:hypothetical protein